MISSPCGGLQRLTPAFGLQRRSGAGLWLPPRTSELYEGWQASPSYLFQTNANTTPVTAAAQTVGRWKGFVLGTNLDQGALGFRPLADFTSPAWGVNFDGVDDFIQGTLAATLAQPTTIYCVSANPGTAKGVYLFDGADVTNRQAMLTDSGVTSGFPDMYAGSEVIGVSRWSLSISAWATVFNGASSKTRYHDNGTSMVNLTGNPGVNSQGGITLGSRYNQLAGSFFAGIIRCLLIYTVVHDDTAIDSVLAALRTQFTAV